MGGEAEEEVLQQECTGGKTTVYGGRGGGGRSRRAASQVRQQASEVGLKGSRGLGGLNLKRGLQVSFSLGAVHNLQVGESVT